MNTRLLLSLLVLLLFPACEEKTPPLVVSQNPWAPPEFFKLNTEPTEGGIFTRGTMINRKTGQTVEERIYVMKAEDVNTEVRLSQENNSGGPTQTHILKKGEPTLIHSSLGHRSWTVTYKEKVGDEYHLEVETNYYIKNPLK
jgi:hypothetical protein